MLIRGICGESLAEVLSQHGLDIGWAIETVLRSEAFFADGNIGNRVQGPVEFVIGAVRALELFDPPPSTLVLAEWCAGLGQDLFEPPNVFGWPGGRTWITTRSIVGRTNFASALTEGALGGRGTPLDALALMQRHGREQDLDAAIAFYSDLILGSQVPADVRAKLAALPGSSSKEYPASVRCAVLALLACPEAQLC